MRAGSGHVFSIIAFLWFSASAFEERAVVVRE